MYYANDTYIGRSLDTYGEYTEAELDLWRQFIRQGMTVVDVGANIGAYTIPLAKMVGPRGRVIAIEAQRQIWQMLIGNLALNEIENTSAIIGAANSALGNVHFPRVNYLLRSNFGAVGYEPGGDYEDSILIPSFPIDEMKLQPVHFIKIDVEGMELEVLKGPDQTIERSKPILYVENDRPEKSHDLNAHIMGLDYRLFWHLSMMFNPKNFAGEADNVFGSFAGINMLCVHSSVKLTIAGLTEIRTPDDVSGAVLGPREKNVWNREQMVAATATS